MTDDDLPIIPRSEKAKGKARAIDSDDSDDELDDDEEDSLPQFSGNEGKERMDNADRDFDVVMHDLDLGLDDVVDQDMVDACYQHDYAAFGGPAGVEDDMAPVASPSSADSGRRLKTQSPTMQEVGQLFLSEADFESDFIPLEAPFGYDDSRLNRFRSLCITDGLQMLLTALEQYPVMSLLLIHSSYIV
jgi:hypothetical protein